MPTRHFPNEIRQWSYVALIGLALAFTSLTRALAQVKSTWTPPPASPPPAVCTAVPEPREPTAQNSCGPGAPATPPSPGQPPKRNR